MEKAARKVANFHKGFIMALLLIRESHYYLLTMTDFKDLKKTSESKVKATKVKKEVTSDVIREKVNPVTQCLLGCNGDPEIEEINLPDFGGSKCKQCWRILSYYKK